MKEDSEILLARIDERQEAMYDTLQKVLAEAIKTNDRVRAVESKLVLLSDHPDRVDKLETWVSKMQGAWKAVVIMATVIGGLVGFGVNYFLLQ